MTNSTRHTASGKDSDRLQGQQEMAGAVAHDINNLLMPIIFQIDLLLKNTDTFNNKDQLIDDLKNIRGAAKDAQEITSKLREFYLLNRESKGTLPISLKELLQITNPSLKKMANTDNHQEKQTATQKSLHILVIDDEKWIGLLMSKYFNSHGHHTETASNGTDGVATFKNNHFDIVITDCEMPDINGYEVAQIIKKTSENTPIILMTGLSGDIEDNENEMEYFENIIQKPIETTTLMDVVNTAIQSCANNNSKND